MKSKHLWFSVIAILSFSVVFMNCATIIHGTTQDISITSSPTAADVLITDNGGVEVFSGTTPSTAKLKRASEYTVSVNLAGYQESKVRINKEFDPTYLGNLLCGGVIGLIIDAADGAMYKLEPGTINVTMMTASIDGNDELYAVLRTVDFDGELREIAIPLIKS